MLQVVVRKLDGIPVLGERIDIEISNWGSASYQKYNKTYHSDVNGLVKFTLPVAAGDLSSFTIYVSSRGFQWHHYGTTLLQNAFHQLFYLSGTSKASWGSKQWQ